MTASSATGPSGGSAKAGRNVPLAIGVGLALGAVVLISLFTYRPLFVGVVAVAIGFACYEVATVLRDAAARHVPLVPLVVGAAGSFAAAYERGSQGLALGVLLTGLALLAWRVLDGGPQPEVAKDLAATLWVLCYVVLLAGFAILLVGQSGGQRREVCYIACVVCSDVGGFAAGVFFGKHPMAPTVSPKKSWEGFAGSAFACVLGGALLVGLVLHGAFWQGAVFGAAVVVSATLGDLGESLIKRDLGVKDMGTLLPGHGGIMDRLDSLLFTAPIAYLLLTAFVPT
jgi:phosphatidate cytidylyltransferase